MHAHKILFLLSNVLFRREEIMNFFCYNKQIKKKAEMLF